MLSWLDTHLVGILNGLAVGSLLFILAVGLSLVFGMMDVLSLAHGAAVGGGLSVMTEPLRSSARPILTRPRDP